MDHMALNLTSSTTPSIAGSDVDSEDDETIELPTYKNSLDSGIGFHLKRPSFSEPDIPVSRNVSPLPAPYVSESPDLNTKSRSYLEPNMLPNMGLESETSNQFTVEREDKNESARNYRRKKSILLSILKCILAFLMSAGLLACAVASKLSLAAIGWKLNYTSDKSSSPQTANSSSRVNQTTETTAALHSELTFCGNSRHSLYQCETVFNMLVLILVIPHIYGFLKALFSSGWKKSHPWPTKRAVIWVRPF